MAPIRSVAVFCGSQPGTNPAYRAAAVALGHALAGAGLKLVFGGGRVGLMGAVAGAAREAGGTVVGVIPDFLRRREVADDTLTDLIITPDMHTRKRRMFELADAFVTMPGGFGTLDETVEIITWRQLGLHTKTLVICNVDGWADMLLSAFEAAITEGFAQSSARDFYEVVTDVEGVMRRLEQTLPSPASMPERT